MSDWFKRQERVQRAVEMLSQAATAKFFRPARAGARPSERVPFNVFFFGRTNQVPRAVVRGYWLYIEAPGAQFPAGVELLKQGEAIEAHHAGRFDARLQLTIPEVESVLSETISAIRAVA